jgi:hypothetical protein
MRPGVSKLLGSMLAAAGLLIVGVAPQTGRGDEPGRIGRLFRLGSSPAPGENASNDPKPATLGASPAGNPDPSLFALPATPAPADPGPAGRIRPQPRVSRPITEADPLVTQIAMARGDDGKPFGLFLQVYTDGTVFDGSGVHRISPNQVRSLARAIQAGELGRFHGHCGGPPTNYLEHVQVVVYERNLGRLRANSFSYSGNPQGCDEALRQFHTALEEIQNRLNGIPSPAPGGPSNVPTSAAPGPLTAPPEPPTVPTNSGTE